MKKSKSLKRNFIEWGIILGVAGFLYLTGLYTEVIGGVQRIVLSTGLMKPNILSEDEQFDADYNFILHSFQGKDLYFSEFRGKTILLNLWASWCPPCRAEMPTIQNLYDEVKKDTNIVFVLISLDDNKTKAEQFVNDKNFNLPFYFLEDGIPAVFSTSTIPTTFVISPGGKIISKETGMAKYDSDNFHDFLINSAKN